MATNNTFKILVNAVIAHEGKILISRRSLGEKHQPGSWTIPGGKVENDQNSDEIMNIVEKTLAKEIREEVGVEIAGRMLFIANNTFRHTEGHIVLALVFLCELQSGTARALEDTVEVAWITPGELNKYEFPPNVLDYIAKGFALLPYLARNKKASGIEE